MAHGYVPVGWNRQKRLYDLWAAGGVLAYLALFTLVSLRADPRAAADTALLRALGTCAFVLLHVVLSIGPLARLDPRFLPLVYNRRHLGVLTFLVALAHGAFVVLQYHALGVVNPLVHVLAGEGPIGGLAGVPFQPLGVAALSILFLMAATSHDFWLASLTAPRWKALHMLVYPAFALVELHVVPRAAKTRLAGEHGGRLKIQVAAPPVEGAANRELAAFFAALLALPRTAVTIERGASGRQKTVAIAGASASRYVR